MAVGSVLTSLGYIHVHHVPVSTLPVFQGKNEDAETLYTPEMENAEEIDSTDHPSVPEPGESIQAS